MVKTLKRKVRRRFPGGTEASPGGPHVQLGSPATSSLTCRTAHARPSRRLGEGSALGPAAPPPRPEVPPFPTSSVTAPVTSHWGHVSQCPLGLHEGRGRTGRRCGRGFVCGSGTAGATPAGSGRAPGSCPSSAVVLQVPVGLKRPESERWRRGRGASARLAGPLAGTGGRGTGTGPGKREGQRLRTGQAAGRGGPGGAPPV